MIEKSAVSSNPQPLRTVADFEQSLSKIDQGIATIRDEWDHSEGIFSHPSSEPFREKKTVKDLTSEIALAKKYNAEQLHQSKKNEDQKLVFTAVQLGDRLNEADALCAAANNVHLCKDIAFGGFFIVAYHALMSGCLSWKSLIPTSVVLTSGLGLFALGTILQPVVNKSLNQQMKIYELTKKLQEKTQPVQTHVNFAAKAA